MNTFIALFRGINVGGDTTLPMEVLVEVLHALGSSQVKTYIRSGNVVFKSAEGEPTALAVKISQAVKQRCGFAPYVLILEPEELEQAIAGNPFPQAEAESNSVHIGFLAAKPEKANLEKLADLKSASEQYRLTDRVFYLYAPEGVGRSRLAAGVEKCLRVTMTDRNWRTVCKIREMIIGEK